MRQTFAEQQIGSIDEDPERSTCSMPIVSECVPQVEGLIGQRDAKQMVVRHSWIPAEDFGIDMTHGEVVMLWHIQSRLH